MTLIEYFKDASTTWKISVFVIIFGTWPLASALILTADPDFFASLDTIKLALISSAITTPFLLINASLASLFLNPSNPELKASRGNVDVLSSSVMISTFCTTIILSIGALFALLGASQMFSICTIGILEFLFIFIAGISAYRERI